MKADPLQQLKTLGPSFWLDHMRRDLIAGGGLKRLIAEDGLRGMTSNPAIFEKAITESHDYDADIRTMAQAGLDEKAIYEMLSRRDVQMAADEFRPLYDRTGGKDGHVSLEVNPHLAHDTRGTIKEARRLWSALNRPNVLIKVPATQAGLPAIRELISEGINVNVTLLFGLPRYRQTTEAYLAGMESRLANENSLARVSSAASFFLSRIDTLVDPLLDKLIARGGEKGELARQARGQVAVASAKMAYQIYKEIFGGNRFAALAARGASVQRILWAGTGTKDPEYSDVKYIEAIIGPDTVNIIPAETLQAFRDHGVPEAGLEQDVEKAAGILARLSELDIRIDAVARQLEDEGVEKSIQLFDMLMQALAHRAAPYKGKGA